MCEQWLWTEKNTKLLYFWSGNLFPSQTLIFSAWSSRLGTKGTVSVAIVNAALSVLCVGLDSLSPVSIILDSWPVVVGGNHANMTFRLTKLLIAGSVPLGQSSCCVLLSVSLFFFLPASSPCLSSICVAEMNLWDF